MSKAEKDHDQTMSVASDDDGQLQYNPSFETVLREGDDDSSVPPPPPPMYGISLAKISSSIFRSRSRESKHVKTGEDEEIGDHRPVQILAAQDHESKSNIEVDAAEQWIKKFGMNKERSGQKRRSKLCTAVLLILVILMVIAIIVSRNADQAKSNQAEKMLVSPTSSPGQVAPSPSPQGEGSKPPTVAATVLPTNATEAPAEPCTSAIVAQEVCYEPQAQINISFTNCAPLPDDWIGIWRAEDVTDVTNLPEPRVWQWVCGAQICETPVEQDAVSFDSGLRPGTYVAQFLHMEQESAPYTGAFASSSTFEVARECA